MNSIHDEVMNALRDCYDPCCREQGISVVDMGLIKQVHIADGKVEIEMLLTTAWCPFVANLFGMIEERVQEIPGVKDVHVQVVWDTVWTQERLSPFARKQLSIPLEPLLPLRAQRLAAQQGG